MRSGRLELLGHVRRLALSRAAVALGQALVDQLGDAAQLGQGGVGMNARNGPAGQAVQIVDCGVEQLGQTGNAAGEGHSPVLPRRELAGEQPEQAAADEMHVSQRIPRLLTQLRLVELERLDCLEHDAAIDQLGGTQLGLRQRLETRPMMAQRGQPGSSAGLGQVRPTVVVSVEANLRRPRRLCREQVVEQPMQREVEDRARLGPGVLGQRSEPATGDLCHSGDLRLNTTSANSGLGEHPSPRRRM